MQASQQRQQQNVQSNRRPVAGHAKWLLLLLALGFSATAFAQDVADPRIARITDRAIAMMPIGQLMEDFQATDPRWPFQERPDVVNATQLACARALLNKVSYRALMLERVQNYAKENPARIDGDLKLLEGPGGQLFAKLITAAARAKQEGKEVDAQALVAGADGAALLGMMQLTSSADYQPVRNLIGVGGSISAKNGEEQGKEAGMTLMLPLLFKAMDQCKIPMSVLTK